MEEMFDMYVTVQIYKVLVLLPYLFSALFLILFNSLFVVSHF